MNRKEFFKKLGIGVATIVVAPKVIAETKAETYPAFDGKIIDKRISDLRKYPLIYKEAYPSSLVINSIWVERKTQDEFALTSLYPKNRVGLTPVLLHSRNGNCPGVAGMYVRKRVDFKYFLKAYYPKYDESERKRIIRDLITFGEAKTNML